MQDLEEECSRKPEITAPLLAHHNGISPPIRSKRNPRLHTNTAEQCMDPRIIKMEIKTLLQSSKHKNNIPTESMGYNENHPKKEMTSSERLQEGGRKEEPQ